MAQGDVMSAEVSVAQNKAAYLKAINQMQNDEDQFKQLIGLDLDHKIGIVTNLEYKPILIDEQKATSEALKNRLEIKETEMDINLMKIEVDRAKRVREFQGNISAYYDLTGINTLEQEQLHNYLNRRLTMYETVRLTGVLLLLSQYLFMTGEEVLRK